MQETSQKAKEAKPGQQRKRSTQERQSQGRVETRAGGGDAARQREHRRARESRGDSMQQAGTRCNRGKKETERQRDKYIDRETEIATETATEEEKGHTTDRGRRERE